MMKREEVFLVATGNYSGLANLTSLLVEGFTGDLCGQVTKDRCSLFHDPDRSRHTGCDPGVLLPGNWLFVLRPCSRAVGTPIFIHVKNLPDVRLFNNRHYFAPHCRKAGTLTGNLRPMVAHHRLQPRTHKLTKLNYKNT